MPPGSGGGEAGDQGDSRMAGSGSSLSGGKRILLLLLNCLPLLHVLLVGVVAWTVPWGVAARIGGAVIVVYLLPPLAGRLLLAMMPLRKTRIRSDEGDFIVWWAVLNLQGLFARFPFLEELLRCIPSLYSTWLRLWGARVGRLTYWAAGTVILDRPFLKIGDDVIFGAGVRLNPHVMVKDTDGMPELLLDTVEIGDRAIVGGYSLLTAGTVLAADECTRAFLVSPPFSRWKGGRREKPGKQPQGQ